jgi:hypothetical protein
MAGRIWKPEIGTMVWFVTEHFWRRPGATKYQPEYEYMVFQGEVRGYRVGNWTDVTILYRDGDPGPIELIDIALSAEKQKIFDNPRDAALYAQELTNEYLKHWGWVWSKDMWPDRPPMPRRWEKYLTEGEEHAGCTTDH